MDFEVTLTKEKETKNTFLYKETPPEGQAPTIQQVYLPKWKLSGGVPDSITVKVSWK